MELQNIFKNLPDDEMEEIFETILTVNGIRVERIVSKGQATPPGHWYDQDWDEWILLLQGTAGLRFEADNHAISLEPGDYLFIPARVRHRVEWTDPKAKTIWLALHLRSEPHNTNR